MGMLLEAVNVDAERPLRWRWLLRDEESGGSLAEHEVSLDPRSVEVARFRDLYAYSRLYAAPDRRTEDGARYVAEAGQWAGSELLGESIGAAIVADAPVTVRVRVPEELSPVLLWPLELAHVAGRPLAAYGDVTLVYDIAPDAPAQRKNETGAALRMLAVFSQPTKTTLLALRRERYELTRLVHRIAARERAVVELQVVQYGVTRERLEEIAGSGDGWDLLHLSGHGGGGAFLLEKADGAPDPVSTADLVKLLRPARHRLKLAVVSACESAADTTAQTLRLLGLTDQADALEAAEAVGAPATQIPGLARALVRDLDCAVVAMRYPVTDEFAIAFGAVLYDHLLSRTHRHTVGVAVARAVARATERGPSAARPAVSLVTPGLFGARALNLAATVPRGKPLTDPAEQWMAFLPDEPRRFVGRAEVMAKAGAALAPDSPRTAVLLHGMAGAGKTACALELAYRHQDAFAVVAFWQAPTKDEEWESALPDLAKRLDIQLADYGFTLASHLGTAADLEAFLPRLRAAMAATGVLLVLDNLETLLTPDGDWLDARWEKVTSALTTHDGHSRVVMTSRVVPAGLDPRVVTLPVHTLPRDEAVALARELPNLGELLHADAGPNRNGIDADADRGRVFRVLRVVQGHPKLLELADAAAADRDRLDAQLAAAEDAANSQADTGQLDAFFHDGYTNLNAGQFLDALTGWTTSTLSVLSSGARLMAEFVACLEDSDRTSQVIDANWPGLWRRLGHQGEPPAPGPLLGVLATAALVEAEAIPGREAAAQAAATAYRVHPGVAAAIIAAAGSGARGAVDAQLGAFWSAVVYQGGERDGEEDSELAARAGLAGAPYLLRRGDWDAVGALIGFAASRDASPEMTQAALPTLRRVAAATGKPADVDTLARVVRRVDPLEAERLLRGALAAAAAAGDYQTASGVATELTFLLGEAGRLAEAVVMSERVAEFVREAGHGPWTQIAAEAVRLQVLVPMGQHAQVLAEVDRLRAAMGELPGRPAENEAVVPWIVRELILGTGLPSALATGDWQRCLDLNAEILASQRQHGAGEYEVTRARFNDAGPMIRLGRLAEAEQLLVECQRVFEDYADTASLAVVFGNRADLQATLKHWRPAADLGRATLRLFYARPEPQGIARGHHNLANYLTELGGDRAEQRAHRLAAALIRWLVGMTHELSGTLRALAEELPEYDGAGPPSTVAEVTGIAERTEGVRLGSLLAVLQPDPRAVEDALAEILRAAADLPRGEGETGIASQLRQWEPVIAGITAACQAGQEPSADLLEFLAETSRHPDWAALVAVLRRILAGEHDETLLDGLDPIDTAIARETLAGIAAPPEDTAKPPAD